jgi:hypothetical protein
MHSGFEEEIQMKKDGALVFESNHSFEEGATVVSHGDGIRISVAEEKAMDSYNETFECSATLSRDQAVELYLWLKAKFA